jgi:uncharacterized protein
MNLHTLRTSLRDVVRKMATGADAAHDLAHSDRVWALARSIAIGEGFELTPVLLCAAYLHDLVSLPKDHPKRDKAAMMSASAAGPLMQALGLSPSEIARTRHAIEAHSHSAAAPASSMEAKILRDADRLEALGAIGIARCFAVAGALDRQLFHPDDPFARARPLDDGTYALDHVAVKLLRLPDTFLTSTGRKLAEERAARIRRYLADLASELGNPPPDW